MPNNWADICWENIIFAGEATIILEEDIILAKKSSNFSGESGIYIRELRIFVRSSILSFGRKEYSWGRKKIFGEESPFSSEKREKIEKFVFFSV